MTRPQTDQNLCICSVLYVLYYISSLCSGGFAVCDYRHVLEVIRTLQAWSGSQDTELPILYKQSLRWWFRSMPLQACVGSVCVGGTALMCRGRECARLGSATRRVSFYAPLVGGGLRLSGPSSGGNGSVRVKYIGHEIANWWVWGGRRSEHCRRCG